MQILRVPWDCKIYMNGYGMGGNLCRNFFGFVSLRCWIFAGLFSLPVGFYLGNWFGGWKKRWSDEMMVLPRDQRGMSFSQSTRLGFVCLNQGMFRRWRRLA